MSEAVRVLVVVPLRLKSQRLPEKILTKIGSGAQAKPLCVWACEKVLRSFADFPFVQVLAAVDDIKTQKILEAALPELTVYLTDPDLPSGTDRVFAAAQEFVKRHPPSEHSLKGIINVQGDMPFLANEGIQEMALFFNEATEDDLAKAPMLTLCQEWPTEKGSPKFEEPSAVKVLLDRSSYAIYFSRFPIPYSRQAAGKGAPEGIAKFHLGVYGYTKDALARFCAAPPAPLEKAEGLEQLRALQMGIPILVFPTEHGPKESYRGIDTPQDLKWAANFYQERILGKRSVTQSAKKTKSKAAPKKVAKKKVKKGRRK